MFELPTGQYSKVERLVDEVPFNTLFAKVVLQKKVRGRVLVDDILSPSVCLVVHKYGMTVLCGNCQSTSFNRELRTFMKNDSVNGNSAKWMICHPLEWEKVLADVLGEDLVTRSGESAPDDTTEIHETDRVVQTERVNFRFGGKLPSPKLAPPPGFVLRRVDSTLYHRIEGSVTPQAFWDNAVDFLRLGIGFSLLVNEQVVSTSFSSFVVGDKLELGVETDSRYRRRGFSVYPSAELIDYCLAYGYEPVWACRRDNIPSFQLALRLGFTPASRHPYYSLPST